MAPRGLANTFSEGLIIRAINAKSKEIELMYLIPVRSNLKYGNVLARSNNLEGFIAFC